MAGVGPYPPTIYIPNPVNRMPGLGAGFAGIGDAIQQIVQRRVQQQAIADTQNLPPEQQVQELMKRGVDPKFVDQLMRIKEAEAGIEASKAHTAEAVAQTQGIGLLNQQREFQISKQDETYALEKKLDMAKINEMNASAAGAGARAAEARENIGLIRAHKQMAEQELQSSQQLTHMLQSVFGDSQGGGQQGGAPTVQPQSYEGGTPRARPIAAGTDEIISPGSQNQAGAGGGAPGAEGGDLASKLAIIQQADTGMPIPQQQPQTLQDMMKRLTPAQKLEIAGAVQQRKPEEIGKIIQEASQPVSTEKQEIGNTGIFVNVGRYSDGTTRPLPGSALEDKRKPADQNLRGMAAGADLWTQTSQILREISQIDNPQSPEADILGNRAVRQINKIFMDHGLQPVGDTSERPFREAYSTVFQHGVIALKLLLPGQRAQQFLNQLQETVAKPTDTKELRMRKLDATEAFADSLINSEVRTAMASKMQVPPTLMDAFKRRGLASQASGADVAKSYIEKLKSIGLTPPDLGSSGAAAPDDEFAGFKVIR